MNIEELKQLNKYLSNLDEWTLKRQLNLKVVQEYESANYDEEKDQGVEGDKYIIYEIEPNIFMKVNYISDSYGNDKGISGVTFVKPVTKTITIYE